MRKTKIIATLGPATSTEERIKELVIAGANVFRINASHGNPEDNQKKVDTVKLVRQSMPNTPLPIMLDTRGPEIRVGKFADEGVFLNTNDTFTFTSDQSFVGNEQMVSIRPSITKNLKAGSIILACDDLVSFIVKEVTEDEVICTVRSGGVLSDNKSVFIPNHITNNSYLNDADKADILWAIENNLEYIAASFVNTKEDVLELREFLDSNGGEKLEIISKVESKISVDNIDEIIEHSNAIMVARGDLGVEIAQEKVPEVQKIIIKKSHQASKMVITATEMLESMTTSPRPTRAETSDVANAVYDGTSAVMLSGETAVGKFPKETVETMARICLSAEQHINYKKRFMARALNDTKISNVMSDAAVHISFMLNDLKAIAVYTDTGHTAKKLSRLYPACPIIALTPKPQTFHKLGLVWGVTPIISEECDSADRLINNINRLFEKHNIAKAGDTVLIGTGSRMPSNTDMIKIHVMV